MHRTLAVTVSLVLAATVAEAEQPPLKTGVDGTFAPHAMPNLAGGIQGFNVDLANEIAKRLKRQITIDATQFSGLLPGLQAGTYDFIAAPTTVTKERAESLLFTEGYLNTDFQSVVKEDMPDIVKLETSRARLCQSTRARPTTWRRARRVDWPERGVVRHEYRCGAGGDRRARRYQVAGNTVAAWPAKNNPAIKLSFLHSTGLVWAAPVRKDNTEMRKKLDEAIECMKKDGTIAAMHEKWFGVKLSRLAAANIFRATACRACPDTTRPSTRRPAPEPVVKLSSPS